MSRRKSICNAIVTKLKELDGTSAEYNTNLYGNVNSGLKFWDEVNDFPCVYVSAGGETREYLPADFKWGFLSVSVKAYTKHPEDAQQQLEMLLEDIETKLDSTNGVIEYSTGLTTTEINITSINTDEGLLAPYGVGEIQLVIRYQV